MNSHRGDVELKLLFERSRTSSDVIFMYGIARGSVDRKQLGKRNSVREGRIDSLEPIVSSFTEINGSEINIS